LQEKDYLGNVIKNVNSHSMKKSKITLIASVRKSDMAIAPKDREKHSELLFDIPIDKRHFAKTTSGKIVISGRKTFKTIPPQYVPFDLGRETVVITRQENLDVPDGVTLYGDLKKSVEDMQRKFPGREIFIAGGGEIYNLSFDEIEVDEIILSVVNDKNEIEADVFFPTGWMDDFNLESKEIKEGFYRDKTPISFSIEIYKRKSM